MTSDNSVQTVEKAFDIVELLSTQNEPMSMTQIGISLGMNKTTVHRFLNTLMGRGYIEKDPSTGKYKLGLKFIEITSLFLNSIEMKTESKPYLRNLANLVSCSVHLATLNGKYAVFIDKVEPLNSIRMYSQIGRHIPAYCSSVGKVLLSGLSDKELDSIINDMDFRKYTPTTITDRESLKKAIEDARLLGWAIDDAEHEEGIRCIAAPVYDYTRKIVAAISASGDMKIMSEDRDVEISKYVMETAMNISKRMGYTKK